jgi:hypothetical protein
MLAQKAGDRTAKVAEFEQARHAVGEPSMLTNFYHDIGVEAPANVVPEQSHVSERTAVAA